MSVKTILVCLTTEQNVETLLDLAVPLARKHDAHLIGLHVIEALLVYPGIAMHVPGPAFGEVNKSQTIQAKLIEEIFEKKTGAEDFQSEWRLVKAESATAADRMIESARAADLVIMAQEDRRWDRANQADAQDRVIRDSGRPVIVVPTDYSGPVPGQNIVLGWSGTREAARAAHDLLLIAEPGASVSILQIGERDRDELLGHSSNDLAEALDRHKLNATVVHRSGDGKDVAEVLNHEAFQSGADLLVTGAFGHSRLYDFTIGAATRDLLTDAKFPVMFSK